MQRGNGGVFGVNIIEEMNWPSAELAVERLKSQKGTTWAEFQVTDAAAEEILGLLEKGRVVLEASASDEHE